MTDDPDHAQHAGGPDLFQRDLVVTLAGALQHQAERLAEQGLKASEFERPIADGIMAVAKAAEKLAELFLAPDLEPEGGEANAIADLSAFFNAAEEQIDQRARERVAALVAQTSIAACPACGASLRTAGSP